MVNNIQSKFKNFNNTIIELKKRIIFLVFALVVFRIGSFIPIPGINSVVLLNFFKVQKSTFIDMFNLLSGGSLSRASIFSLGIMPYVSSSIIMQLLPFLFKSFSYLKKGGELGRKKIHQYTRYLTFFLALFQSVGVSITLPHIPGLSGLITNPNMTFYVVSIISVVTGSMLLMWLGELITEYGIGNGISVIVFIGIISKLPFFIFNTIKQFKEHDFFFLKIFMIFVFIFFVTVFVVFFERSYRKVVLYYAKHNNMRKMYAVQNTYLPIKLNMSGVIPSIFSSGCIVFFSTILYGLGYILKCNFLIILSSYLQPGNFLYFFIYIVLVFILCFFYSYLSFNPREISDNLKKTGAFIPGIRPGQKTSKYINNIMMKLILFNTVYIIFICLVPEIIKMIFHVPFCFGGTSLLIVVVVIMDGIIQIQTLLLSKKYSSLLKKSPFHNNSLS